MILSFIADHSQIQICIIENSEIKNIPVSGNITTDSSLNLLNLAIKGVGIVYLASFTVFRELKEGRLVQVLSENLLPPKEMYAVYSKNRYHVKKVKALLDFLTQKIQGQK